MKNIHSIRKVYSIDSPTGVAVVIFNNLQNSRPSKPLQRLGARIFPATLRHKEGKTENVLSFFRQSSHIIQGAANPFNRL